MLVFELFYWGGIDLDFVERFEQLCREENESPTVIFTRLGFSRGTVSKWRNGKSFPQGSSLQKIAKHFDVSVDYLLGKSDIRSEKQICDDTKKVKAILFGNIDLPDKAWHEVLEFVEHTKRKYHLS